MRGLWARRAWVWPALIMLFLAAGSLDGSSYFLHFDTPELHVAAANLVRGCWASATGKPGVMLILVAADAVAGINPLWDTIIVTLLGALTMSAFFRLTARLTGSQRWAMAGALWFLSMPIVLYYTRMHVGYALAFFVLGLMLQFDERYGWAGLAFGQALTSHLTVLVPLGAWLGWSALLHEGPGRARKFGRLGVSVLPPILVVESLTFLFNRNPFGWIRSVLGVASRTGAVQGDTNWLHLWEVVRFPNGWVNAGLLLVGVLYPLVRRPRVARMDAIYLAGWSVVGLYTLRVGLAHTTFLSRLLTGVYPLLALASIFTVMRLMARLRERLAARGSLVYRLVVACAVALALPLALINHVLDAAVSSRTAYAAVDRAVAEAGEGGLAVRYAGNPHAARLFGLRYRVEMSINETSPDVITADRRAVLIFEDDTVLEDLRADPRIRPADYEVTTYAHGTESRPERVEEFFIPTHDLVAFGKEPFARQPGAPDLQLEIWWPRDPSGTFQARRVVDFDAQTFITHYDGGRCSAPKPFADGTKNYYEILWERVLDFVAR